MIEHTSEFKFYSFGKVVENKPISTKYALVAPMEVTPLLDGELSSELTEVEATGRDEYGKPYSIKIKSGLFIRCLWLPFGSNRDSAPDVRRGERVAIYRYADSDVFYWVSMGLDDHLRRLETAIYRFSNVPDGTSNEELNYDNCHILEINAHKKLINLSTSKSNGEPFRFFLSFNLGEGCVTLADDLKNYFEFDSYETKITMHNNDGTWVSLDKKDLKAYAPNDFIFELENDFRIRVGNNFNCQVKNKIDFSCKEWLVAATTSFTVDSPKSKFTGSVEIGEELKVDGSSTFGGAMTANGITSSKPITGPRDSI